MKSKECLFKLRQDTEKAEIFADQIEEQATRKLGLIKKRQELEEAEKLNSEAEAKEKLKVAQMLETLVKVNKLCFNCLSNSHMINSCKSKKEAPHVVTFS